MLYTCITIVSYDAQGITCKRVITRLHILLYTSVRLCQVTGVCVGLCMMVILLPNDCYRNAVMLPQPYFLILATDHWYCGMLQYYHF
jgi:hypothetical protein